MSTTDAVTARVFVQSTPRRARHMRRYAYSNQRTDIKYAC